MSEFGPALANSGMKLSGFDPKTNSFKNIEKLPIPNALDSRKIQPLGDGRYVVVSNAGRAYVF